MNISCPSLIDGFDHLDAAPPILTPGQLAKSLSRLEQMRYEAKHAMAQMEACLERDEFGMRSHYLNQARLRRLEVGRIEQRMYGERNHMTCYRAEA